MGGAETPLVSKNPGENLGVRSSVKTSDILEITRTTEPDGRSARRCKIRKSCLT
jgi:hypothetical protein